MQRPVHRSQDLRPQGEPQENTAPADPCYHGEAIEDEHLWRPLFYTHPEKLEQRFESLKETVFRGVVGRRDALGGL